MTTFALAGVALTPLVLSDVRPNDVIVAGSLDGRWAETIARSVTTSFGSIAANCGTCSGATVKRHAVQGTFSRARRDSVPPFWHRRPNTRIRLQHC